MGNLEQSNIASPCPLVEPVLQLHKKLIDTHYYVFQEVLIYNSTSSSVRVTTELHEKHAHAYLVIAVLLSGQSTRVLLHGTKFLVFTTITFYGSSYLNLCSKPDTHNCQESPSVTIFLV